MAPASSDRLLSDEATINDKLYNPEALLEVSSSVAQGYITLLSNGTSSSNTNTNKKNKKKKSKKSKKDAKEQEDLSLAFMALTSGNVVDACFGVKTPSAASSARSTSPANRAAADAKALLGDCDDKIGDAGIDDENESYRRTAVHAYCDAFKVVVIHQDKMNQLNCFTRCFRTKKIRTESQKDLQEAFSQLAHIISEQST